MAARPSAAVTVDFTGVSNREVIPEDDYDVEVDECTVEASENGQYLKWTFIVTEGPHTGAKVFTNTSLLPQSLWVLRNVLVACGVEVPAEKMQIIPSKYIGKRCGISVVHRDWQGKKQPRIVDFFPARGSETANENDGPLETVADEDL